MRALVWNSWFIILVGTPESETNMVLMSPKRLENTKRNEHASWHKVCKFGKIFQKNTFIRGLAGQTFYQSNKEGTLRGASAWLRISVVDLFSSPAWRYKMLLLNWASWLPMRRSPKNKNEEVVLNTQKPGEHNYHNEMQDCCASWLSKGKIFHHRTQQESCWTLSYSSHLGTLDSSHQRSGKHEKCLHSGMAN